MKAKTGFTDNLPATSISTLEQLNGFRAWIGTRIKGQPEVLEALDRHFGRSELGLTDPDFVLGAFLFVGPTGVGKTETALLAAEYFLGPQAVARLNMAEFKESKSVGELRERLSQARRAGKRFYLFDEIEKAHWEVLDLLLQILEKGAEVASPDGSPFSFTDSYIVMTSNLGAREAMRSRTGNYTSFSNTVREHVVRYRSVAHAVHTSSLHPASFHRSRFGPHGTPPYRFSSQTPVLPSGGRAHANPRNTDSRARNRTLSRRSSLRLANTLRRLTDTDSATDEVARGTRHIGH